MKKYIAKLLGAIYLISFVRNSMYIAETSLELYFTIFTYSLVALLAISSLLTLKPNERNISREHFFILSIAFFNLIYFDRGHTQFFMLLLMVMLIRINDDLTFLLPICKIITIILSAILFAHITGIYRFPVIRTYNIIKGGDSAVLGFRTANGFGGYCYNVILVFYLFKKWRWLFLTVIIEVISTFYTQSRAPMLTLFTLLLLSCLKSKFFTKRTAVSLITSATFLITFFGFATLFYAGKLMRIVLWGEFNLDQLTSARLSIIHYLTKDLSPFEWFFGSSTTIADSLYFFFIGFYGIIFTFLILIPLIKKYKYLVAMRQLDWLIILAVILTGGVFEIQLSPYLPSGILFFVLLFYPDWVSQQLPLIANKVNRNVIN